jgi:hypothetical protein
LEESEKWKRLILESIEREAKKDKKISILKEKNSKLEAEISHLLKNKNK